jgi:hypothetical protein
MRIARILSDELGGVLVEATVMILLTLILILGSVDFLFAFYQWNMANKAAQFGARIAAVSDPVASDLPGFAAYGSLAAGDPLPTNSSLYEWDCNVDPNLGTCSGTSSGYSASAMNTIVYGRNWLVTGNASCVPTTNLYLRGMCHMFSRIGPAQVAITYKDTGLGFAYQPGGPTPTIIVRLQNLPFHFFFLSGLMGFDNISIPAEATSMTGEDHSTPFPP